MVLSLHQIKRILRSWIMNQNNLDVIKKIKSKKVHIKDNNNNENDTLDFYSSWALYELSEQDIRKYIPKGNLHLPTGDLSFPDDSDEVLSEKINTDVIMYALNASPRGINKGGPWLNFHDIRPKSHDSRLLFELLDTKFWGAYMSDLFKDFTKPSETLDVDKFISDMNSDEDNEAKRNLKILQFEIDTINPRIIILYHEKSEDAFNKMIKAGLIKIPDNCQTVYRPHYSRGDGYEKRSKALVKESKEIYGE